ncbi:MAG: FprA family A-type flavoprotein [Oscillospiraceae bacterium]
MSTINIAADTYSVGVLNPNLRIFDIIMYAEYGTSYNAYLINDEKSVLIETVHEDFFEEYKNNVEQIIDISKIDYLIVNHTEPDHSGSIIKLLELNPDITVFGTAAAGKNLSQIANRDLNFKVVRAGERLELGKHTLEFCPAPFLHWPDSMFTLDKQTEIAYTCDFLGTHFCEPNMLDKFIKDDDKYSEAFKYYFDCIFGPFKPYVLEGLEKLSSLNPRMVCPSHGPILQERLSAAMAAYKDFATPKEQGKSFAIIYASAYGYTKALAESAADAVKSLGIEVELLDIVKCGVPEAADALANADGFLIGANTINRNAPKPIWDVLSHIDAVNTSKPVGAFGSYGWSGEAVPLLKAKLLGLRFKFVDDGFKNLFRPTDDDLKAVAEYALAVAGSLVK